MKVIVGSGSKQKVTITEKVMRAFSKSQVQVHGCAVSSGVPETPFGRETFEGACNRAKGACNQIAGADYCVGLENGLIERYEHIYEEAWAAVLAADGNIYFGYSSGLKVPDCILQKMDALHLPHSEVMALIERERGTIPNDTWRTYSGGLIVRAMSLEEALRNACIQIFSPPTSLFEKKLNHK